jgi:uncharacterized membrane protein (DUF2068 family)
MNTIRGRRRPNHELLLLYEPLEKANPKGLASHKRLTSSNRSVATNIYEPYEPYELNRHRSRSPPHSPSALSPTRE